MTNPMAAMLVYLTKEVNYNSFVRDSIIVAVTSRTSTLERVEKSFSGIILPTCNSHAYATEQELNAN